MAVNRKVKFSFLGEERSQAYSTLLLRGNTLRLWNVRSRRSAAEARNTSVLLLRHCANQHHWKQKLFVLG